ncbi:MAG: glycosyltransferase [Bacteroides sp.]|nr:glycosyltransferase [Bacteroides sp.]
MNGTPEISVIIPVYKVEKYLHLCIDSVLNQTFQDLEIILVDDGSPDNCPEICEEYARKDHRVKVIHKENAGLGMARNTGLDNACGKYVCFLDSDDALALNTLEVCHGIAVKEDADQVRFMFNRLNDISRADLKPIDTDSAYSIGVGREGLEPILNVISQIATELRFNAATNASACSALFRRSIIVDNNIRFLSERRLMSEDFIFNLDFGVMCERIVYTTNPFYLYRNTASSLSRGFNFNRVERACEFSKFYADRLKEYGYKNAEVNAMGYTLGEIRSFNKLLFSSDFTNRRRRELFLEIPEMTYVKRIMSEYPLEKLPMMQRIAFKLHVDRHFWLSYLITYLRRFLKDKL